MLNSIGFEHSWMAPFIQTLQTLEVRVCNCLRNLVSSTVSFSLLAQLIVKDSDGLKYLFTSTTAKSLVALEKMEIANCKSLRIIMFEEAKESSSHDEDEIIFEHLKTLSLHNLPSLGRFYNGRSCTLNLPSLEKLSVNNCCKMRTFSEGTVSANKLSEVEFEENADAVPLEVDLNSTLRNAFLAFTSKQTASPGVLYPNMQIQPQEHLVLGDSHELQGMWLGVEPIRDGSFSNLKSLVVEQCKFLSNAILPSHLLPLLRKLEELKVQKCNSVEAIFDIKDTQTHHTKKRGPFSNKKRKNKRPASPLHLGLKKLILEELPNLKHVWNEDPQGSISLPFLEVVSVDRCERIKSLFPASVAKGILKTLTVNSCESLVEIVAKDGAIEELIIFPSLTSLTLWSLPNLKCFYPGMHNLEWPMLTVLDVYKCQKLKVFVTDFQNCPDSDAMGLDCSPTEQQALVSADMVMPRLEELSLNKEDVMMIEQGQLHVDLQNLKYLKLLCWYDESNIFPYVFLSKVPLPSIEKLEVRDSDLKEIFPSQRPDIVDTKILSQLKGLVLNYLPMLSSIGFEHSWMAPFPECIETLNVLVCDCLTNLVASTVSFSHLTELIVEDCDGLEYLFTSSTANSLGVLEKMDISNCKSLKKIVENEPKDNLPEDHEPHEEEMIFGKLEILSLSFLPTLGSFYTGSSTLKFPALKEVSFTQCYNMKMFCPGDVDVPKNLEVKIDGVCWSGDINTAIKRKFGAGSSLS